MAEKVTSVDVAMLFCTMPLAVVAAVALLVLEVSLVAVSVPSITMAVASETKPRLSRSMKSPELKPLIVSEQLTPIIIRFGPVPMSMVPVPPNVAPNKLPPMSSINPALLRLPPGCELATMYTAAVTARAANAKQAQRLIDLLIDAGQRELRERAGFLGVKK